MDETPCSASHYSASGTRGLRLQLVDGTEDDRWGAWWRYEAGMEWRGVLRAAQFWWTMTMTTTMTLSRSGITPGND